MPDKDLYGIWGLLSVQTISQLLMHSRFMATIWRFSKFDNNLPRGILDYCLLFLLPTHCSFLKFLTCGPYIFFSLSGFPATIPGRKYCTIWVFAFMSLLFYRSQM